MRHEKTVSVSKIKPLWEPWEEDETPRKSLSISICFPVVNNFGCALLCNHLKVLRHIEVNGQPVSTVCSDFLVDLWLSLGTYLHELFLSPHCYCWQKGRCPLAFVKANLLYIYQNWRKPGKRSKQGFFSTSTEERKYVKAICQLFFHKHYSTGITLLCTTYATVIHHPPRPGWSVAWKVFNFRSIE